MKALTVRQPWSWAIIHAGKDVENRSWSTRYRGPLLIHAGKRMDALDVAADDDIRRGRIPTSNGLIYLHHRYGHPIWGAEPPAVPLDLGWGVVIGVVDLVGISTTSESEWFTGPYGWMLANPRPLPFTPWKGRQGLFDIPDAEVAGL